MYTPGNEIRLQRSLEAACDEICATQSSGLSRAAAAPIAAMPQQGARRIVRISFFFCCFFSFLFVFFIFVAFVHRGAPLRVCVTQTDRRRSEVGAWNGLQRRCRKQHRRCQQQRGCHAHAHPPLLRRIVRTLPLCQLGLQETQQRWRWHVTKQMVAHSHQRVAQRPQVRRHTPHRDHCNRSLLHEDEELADAKDAQEGCKRRGQRKRAERRNAANHHAERAHGIGAAQRRAERVQCGAAGDGPQHTCDDRHGAKRDVRVLCACVAAVLEEQLAARLRPPVCVDAEDGDIQRIAAGGCQPHWHTYHLLRISQERRGCRGKRSRHAGCAVPVHCVQTERRRCGRKHHEWHHEQRLQRKRRAPAQH
mmetsp:Transcript_26818/g.79638  ORF Transcript_26818/g.79638 Transcript_26818/m.79638 type:complete len:363 (-) Transcript_26818:455-1543(-)